MPPENPHAGGVKRGHPDALRSKAHQAVHPLPHLPRRLIGKGDSQNIPGIDPLLLDEIGNPVGQHPGLPRARPG